MKTKFEKTLLIIGVCITLVAIYLLKEAYYFEESYTWLMILAIFSWLTVLILFVVVTLSAEIKDELKEILKENLEETKLLKEVSQAQLKASHDLKKALQKSVITGKGRAKIKK